MSPKPANSKWNGDQQAAQRLALAQKAAKKAEKPRTSWWTEATSREDFNARLKSRHAEILNSASNATRSINRAI